LSNGSAFANEKFLVKSKEHGLTEILFSLHGYDAQSHDSIVRHPGGWKRIIKAIELCKKHNIVIRLNCTVYQRNYKGLAKYSDVVKQISPLQVNFLTLNYWVNNKNFEPLDYPAVTEYIKRCIDEIKDSVEYINVRYTPYCFMKGYEQYICNQYQHIYDVYDWNKEIYNYDIDVDRSYTDNEKIDLGYSAAARGRLDGYSKPKECIKCKHFHICDGVENEVSVTVFPESGQKITDVNYYRKNFYAKACIA
jgi:MoaA/NifB/PqqE/SkfB family radical SAM enzyme